MRVVVIMAGGSGERFWPLSRRNHPKQLLNLSRPDRSLLEEAVERSLSLAPREQIFVATGRHLEDAIRQAKLGIPDANVIAEPCKRNTAGCLCYAAAIMMSRFGCEASAITMGVLTSDHRIPDTASFAATAEAAFEAADVHDALVTIGIQPQRPDTGFGYIEIAEHAEPVAGVSADRPAYPVLQFREKPTLEEAETFLAAQRFFWNSGMFFWRISTFLSEFDHANQLFSRAVLQMTEAMRGCDQHQVESIFSALPDVSIDYALMEGARRVLVAPGRFFWEDLGAWNILDQTLPQDGMGNTIVGEPVLVDCENCIVYNAPGAENRAVAMVGVNDLIVVVSDDAILVVPKSRAQDVKAAVKVLKERGARQL